jgi:flagellar hook-length control protein FliK
VPVEAEPTASDDVAIDRTAGAQVSTARTATTPIAPSSDPAPVRPAVHTPIVTAVVPLIERGDGSYHVAVRLHPNELGAVDVDVELRNGEVNLRLRAENEAGRDAIRAALPALRSELEAAGVRAGTFDLGDRPSGQAPEERRQPMPNARMEPLPETTDDTDVDVAGDNALDVRL